MAKRLERPLGGARFGHHIGHLKLAAQRLLDGITDSRARPAFILVAIELARHRDGVEREAIGRV